MFSVLFLRRNCFSCKNPHEQNTNRTGENGAPLSALRNAHIAQKKNRRAVHGRFRNKQLFDFVRSQITQSQNSSLVFTGPPWLYSSSGALAFTFMFAGIDRTIKVLPPIVTFSPMTVSPPRTEAPE